MRALALKYRPKNYDELIGQDTIAKSLSHALDTSRLGHAYLFSGLRGSGKTSSARIFAKALLCEKGPTSRPCEVCDSCVMANEGRHLDIIEMDAASHRKIDDIRELIEQSRYAPSNSRFKIFIIDEVHMLTKEASNALLKTLEEPPSYVKFILATTDPLKLPPTVLSRTQHFRFKPITKDKIVAHLKFILENENIAYEDLALEILSRNGSGSLRDTITLLDQAIIYGKESVSAAVVADMLGLLDPAKIDEMLSVILNQDRDRMIEIIKETSGYEAVTIIDEIIANLKDKFLRKDPTFSLLMYERFFRILAQSKHAISISNDDSFSLAMAFFMMMEAVNIRSIDDMIKTTQKPSYQEPTMAIKQEEPKKETAKKDISAQIPQTSPYELFIAKIYDRDSELGELFDRCIEFLRFEDNVLVLNSHAKGSDQDNLRAASKAIMQILRATFNQNTAIKIEQNDTAVKKNEPKDDIKKVEIKNSYEKLMSFEEKKIDKKEQSIQALSGIESVEISNEERNRKELDRLFGKPIVERI